MYNVKGCLKLPAIACLAFAFLVILLLFCGTVCADYFQPAPPSNIITNQTSISVSSTIPSRTFDLNITEYDAKQMIKSLSIECSEPIAYLSFVVEVLAEKPYYINAPETVPVVQYYSIRFLTDLADKIESITVVFVIEKNQTIIANVEERSILHYQYGGNKFEKSPIEKVDEDNEFLYFRTVVEGANYFAVTGTASTIPLWPAFIVTVVVVFLAVVGTLIYKKTRATQTQKQVRT